ncbi:CU044_5270 family protein [Actinomadura welshii]|uniref:CU044_5270 family protein n=1 Tax=Actinomadura welshii TaxID=3103817 RepID=UPI0003AD25E8|nr:CU044_5270 family protein [Actinomadura madurae]
MDELRTIREAYGEPAPPTAREIADARAVWDGKPARRTLFGWPARLGLGIVAAGAAAAVAVAVTAQGSPEAPPSRVDLGRQAVLAAAAKAELMPTGKYWYTDQIQGQSYMMRPKTGSYAIVGAHSETFQWAAAKQGGGEAFYGRDLPSRPLTAKDEAAWRRAGSPTKFKVWSNDHYYTYGQKTTGWEVDDPDPAGGGKYFVQGTGRSLTVAEIQRLPTDPEALATMFYAPKPPRDSKGVRPFERKAGRPLDRKAVRPLDRMSTPSAKLGVTAALLENTPLPPKVRAGLMRALAAQPGIRSLGKATDPLGRKGVALATEDRPSTVDGEYGAPPEEQGTYKARSELVFDPATGELLAEQLVLTEPGGAYRDREPGFVINYWLVRDTGWTDAKPKPPAKPPF